MNLNYLYLFLSQPSVIWGLWERRFHSNMFGTLAGSEPHQEPSSQEKVFFTGGCFDLFYAFHIPSTLKGHLTASHLSPEPPGLTQPMSCAFSTPKNHDHLKPQAALREGPDDLKIHQGSSWGKQGLCMWT